MGSSVSASSQLRIPPARGHILPRFLSLQAASGPRVFCVPQIILTECTSSSPTLPQTTLEELGPQAVPTPRPRTLAGSGKTWNGPQALLGLATEVLWPRSSSESGKEPAVLQSSHSTEARVLCLQGPSPDETQKTFPVETHLEETPQNSVCDIRACSRGPRGISSGCTEQDAALLRMDSLEETLQELETTLSEMGAKSTMPCPGSPQSLRPHPQSGGGSVPPMKVVTPGASRLKAAQGPAGSPDKGKHGKQRTEYMRIQAQQQATKPSKEMSGPNETSSPVSEKPSGSRTSIPVLTSFGARNSSISF